MRAVCSKSRGRARRTAQANVTIGFNTDVDMTPDHLRVYPRNVSVGDRKSDVHVWLSEDPDLGAGVFLFGGSVQGDTSGRVEIDGTSVTLQRLADFADAIKLAIDAARNLPARKTGQPRYPS